MTDPRFDLGRCKLCNCWAQRLNWSLVRNEERGTIGHAAECKGLGDLSTFDEDTFVREVDRGYGYAHSTHGGTCGPKVTTKDIEHLKYHSYFGGRDAWSSGGKWGAIRHTD